MGHTPLNPAIIEAVQSMLEGSVKPEETRVEKLGEITAYLKAARASNTSANLVFICTHNSRRSQVAQLWAWIAAEYFDLDNVKVYSGGTEATAFALPAIRAMESFGVRFTRLSDDGKNPAYAAHIGRSIPDLLLYSKKFDASSNPQQGFAAIMVCSDADEGCPVVQGCDVRISLPYTDPKASDNTPPEKETYLATCREIGREMLYAFQMAAENTLLKHTTSA